MRIFIDIETFGGEKPNMDEVKVPGNISKPETIEKWKKESADEEWRKQALNSLKGKIVCIGVSIDNNDTVSFCGEYEEEIMTDFVNYIEENVPEKDLWTAEWVAHNGLHFDFPWLQHRILKYKLARVMPDVDRKLYIDTMRLFGFTDRYAMYSLDNIAKFLGIEGKKNGISGKDIHDMVLADKWDEISEYCKDDVKLLRNIYGRTI